MSQIIIKILLVLIYLYISFHVIRTIFINEIDIGFPFKWIRNTVESYIPVKNSELDISPGYILLKTDNWKSSSSFNIHNKTNNSIYDIYIKLEIESPGIESKDINVIPKKNSDFMETSLGNVSVNFDFVQLLGVDNNGKEFIYLIIYNIDPYETQSFKISIGENLKTDLKQAKINIKFIKSSEKPPQILYQGNKAAFPFTLVEKTTIKGQRIFIKKK